MFNKIRKRKRVNLFSNRSKLRAINQLIKRATHEQDVAEVEELMEEKYRFIESLF